MLAVAREAATKAGLAISWHDGAAEKTPFPDRAFDIVCCQFGLMFFEDRSVALAEMRRVLSPDGRVALAVFQPIERHPFYRALHEAIERRLGTSGVNQIFALGDRDGLSSLVAGAGFGEPRIESFDLTANFGEPATFIAGEIDVDTAAIPAMQQLDQPSRERLTAELQRDMEGALAAVTRDGQVHMPFHVLMATAKPA